MRKCLTIVLCACCTLLLILASGCQPVQQSPVPTKEDLAPTQTPIISSSPVVEQTPVPEDVLGFELPAPNEDGMREYRYNEQLVNDWLGDFSQANSVRKLLLDYLDTTENTKEGNWNDEYHMLILGCPCVVEEGWIVPAGKRLDGEWLPKLFYVTNNGNVARIVAKTQSADVWSINRSRLITASYTYSVYYGFVPTEEDIDAAHPIEVIITDQHGNEQTSVVPSGYPAYPVFLAAFPDDGVMSDIRIIDAISKHEYKPTLRNEEGYRKVQRGETRKFLPYNFFGASFYRFDNSLPWDDVPELKRIETVEPFLAWGNIYDADLYKDGKRLRVTAHAPLDQVYLERVLSRQIGPKRNVVFELSSKAFGDPTDVKAFLYTPDDIKSLEYAGGRIEVGELKEAGRIEAGRLKDAIRYMLHVRAEFGTYGYIEWWVPMA